MSEKKNCQPISRLLEKFLDGELTPQQEQMVKAELAECESCRIEYEKVSRLRALVREVYVEEARRADLDDLLPGVIERIKSRPPSLKSRLADWIERYRIGLASPVAPIGVAATVAVAIIAATLIYATNSTPDGAHKSVAPTLAESKSESGPADEPAPPGATAPDESALAKTQVRTPRRPRHEERPFRKNESYITYYNAKSGTVIVDADPDGEDPTVVWHFADEGGAVLEDNKI